MNVTLGSLLSEDLRDLEELGLIPEPEEMEKKPTTPAITTLTRESHGVPWFDSMVEGTRLGNLRRTHGQGQWQDGKIKVEWEIVEWTDGDNSINNNDSQDVEMDTEKSSPAKRKLHDRDEADAAV
jgi:hypothetical protein